MATCSDFLKGYLLIGCIFNVCLAIGAFIAGVYLNNLRSEFLVNDGAGSIRKYIVIGLYVLGALCALTGLLGIFAFWKKIRCFQTLFIIFNLFFFLIFAVLFAGLMIAQPYLNEMKNSKCESISALQSANQLFVDNFKTKYCKKNSQLNLVCPCYVTDTSKWTADELSKVEFSSVSGIKSILDCKDPNVQSQISSKSVEISLLQAVEEEFSCTGICEGDVIYYFSDITRGPPKTADGCFPQFRDFLLKITGGVFIFVVIATVFTFLNVVIGFINCCCQKPAEEEKEQEHQRKNNNNNSFEMSARKPLNNHYEQTNQTQQQKAAMMHRIN